MKGDVKRNISPHDWKIKASLHIQPRLCSRSHPEYLVSSLVVHGRRPCVVPGLRRASKDVAVVATGWFYRRLDAYSFLRVIRGGIE